MIPSDLTPLEIAFEAYALNPTPANLIWLLTELYPPTRPTIH